jgi:oligosaccharide repeat unit polymerase
LDADALQQTGGSFSNYFLLSVNFLIPGIALLFIYWLRNRSKLLWFILPAVAASGIYITLGFRYRIILLIGALGTVYFLHTRRKLNVFVAPVFIVSIIAFMGLINITRNYSSGLDVSKLEDDGKNESYYRSGLRESLIFQTSGAVIDNVPARHPFVGFTPIISTVLFPVPQQLYKEKNSAGYIVSILTTIYGPRHFKGGAFMSYAEHYMAFGWIGIIVAGFIIGWVYKNLWLWYRSNNDNPWVIVAYAVTVVYTYVILSRGYLPQVTMLFFFSVFPIYFIIRLAKKKQLIILPNPALSSGA